MGGTSILLYLNSTSTPQHLLEGVKKPSHTIFSYLLTLRIGCDDVSTCFHSRVLVYLQLNASLDAVSVHVSHPHSRVRGCLHQNANDRNGLPGSLASTAFGQAPQISEDLKTASLKCLRILDRTRYSENATILGERRQCRKF